MPAEAKSPTAPLADANAQTPKKKQPVGKAALAKVTLLDGSVLDVTIDVSVTFQSTGKMSYETFVCMHFFSAKRKERIY